MGFLVSMWRNTSGCLKKTDRININTKIQRLVVDERLTTKFRLIFKNLMMALNGSLPHPSLTPPESVQGMTTLEREKFNTTVRVPGIKLPKKDINATQKNWKSLLLKMRGMKNVANLDDKDPLKDSHCLILLDPGKLDSNTEALEKLGMTPESVEKYEVTIGYNNWSVSDIMRAVLPQCSDNVTSFTQIGHIAHLNLREENLQFKHLIGDVIIDKVPIVKMVVNKLASIDNTYRNFEMELLAGEKNYVTQTKEHGCVFELDFSKVYWNSRLSTEHQRIVDSITKGSVVYDVFAGIGPFAVPLSKKKSCTIFANDLNPSSFQYLKRNVELNKLKKDCVQTYNMDGRDFIKSVVKQDLRERIEALYSRQEKVTVTGADQREKLSEDISTTNAPSASTDDKESMCPPTVAVMNLPALAVDFLDAFVALLGDLPPMYQDPALMDPILPTVYCYAFCEKTAQDIEGEVKRRAETVMQHRLPSDASVRMVRNVSPNKDMVCLMFKLSSSLVLNPGIKGDECAEPDSKKQKCS